MPATGRSETHPLSLHDALPIFNKALEKDRSLRYQSAADLRGDLKRLRRDTDSGRSAAVSAATGAVERTAASTASGTAAFRSGLSRSEEHTSELQSLRHLVCRLRGAPRLTPFPYTTRFRSSTRRWKRTAHCAIRARRTCAGT